MQQLDRVAAELKAHGTQSQALHAEQPIVGRTADGAVGDGVELQHLGIERDRAFGVRDRYTDRVDPTDERLGHRDRAPRTSQHDQQQQRPS